MLRELHISNLAVIADAKVELAAGLNCFTGETGAGKSLVIGAIGVLLGLRSASTLLRRGAREGRVSGVFEIGDDTLRQALSAATDVPFDEDADLLLTRRIFASGRTSASVNGHPVTLGMLRAAGELLADVHGQHDHVFLLKAANQLDVLDQYARLEKPRTEHAATWSELQATRAKIADLRRGEKDRTQRIDFLKFQLDEIEAAAPDADEFEALEKKASKLGNLETLKTDSTAAHDALYENDDALVERLRSIGRSLDHLSDLDAEVKPIAEAVKSATLQLDEAARDLGRYTQKLDLDPAELEETQTRLNTLNRLLKKYGPSMADVLAFRDGLRAELADLDGAGDNADALEAKLKPLAEKREKLAAVLTKKRGAAARKLTPLIESQLAELGMPKAKFRVDVAPGEPSAAGDDAVEFVAQTNPGLEPQPLRKIASGGELSRIMLALKQVLAQGDRISVLVFDEIDANVGGRLGSVIGSKLRHLAEAHQVLCITHLPQIAAHADRHLTVRKDQAGDATVSTVEVMTGESRVEELAAMIGGAKITETTRAQARELLDVARR
ncbi:MAG: DNA repair protein RecN [Planctomycetota bacterium]